MKYLMATVLAGFLSVVSSAHTPLYYGMGRLFKATNGVAFSLSAMVHYDVGQSSDVMSDVLVSFPRASYDDSRYSGEIHVVLINRCQGRPEQVSQCVTGPTGTFSEISHCHFDVVYPKSPTCSNELAVFIGGDWLVDPITGLHNFGI